ncbi:MAG: hypothetical protein ACE5HA_12520 [Anaerolineae bacterium]
MPPVTPPAPALSQPPHPPPWPAPACASHHHHLGRTVDPARLPPTAFRE